MDNKYPMKTEELSELSRLIARRGGRPGGGGACLPFIASGSSGWYACD